jgi:hypothetical protein
MSLSTPVAFIIFNRPEITKKVFAAIRQAKPEKLLVIADGPRFPEEAEKCKKTREIVNQIDWKCEVLTNFSEINLGCKQRVSSGIDWVFSEVEEAIILEDDCLPAPSFFSFCQTLLEYYRDDKRIMVISGDNFVEYKSDYSYRFSKYSHTWGWASWRRAWQYYDVEIKSWPKYKQENLLSSVCEHPAEQKYWTEIFDKIFAGTINASCWDYQWNYICWTQSGLSVLPNSNLISNIGFGSDATHTIDDNPYAKLPITDIWEIKHPLFVVRDREADEHTFNSVFGGNNRRNLLTKIRHRVSTIKDKARLLGQI